MTRSEFNEITREDRIKAGRTVRALKALFDTPEDIEELREMIVERRAAKAAWAKILGDGK